MPLLAPDDANMLIELAPERESWLAQARAYRLQWRGQSVAALRPNNQLGHLRGGVQVL